MKLVTLFECNTDILFVVPSQFCSCWLKVTKRWERWVF